jgi:hypothetical protein
MDKKINNKENRLVATLKKENGPRVSAIGGALFGLFLAAGILFAAFMDGQAADWVIGLVVLSAALLGTACMFSIQVARQWEKAIVLRFGKYIGLKGPGIFLIVPVIDQIPVWVDHRVIGNALQRGKDPHQRHRPRGRGRRAVLGCVGRREGCSGS